MPQNLHHITAIHQSEFIRIGKTGIHFFCTAEKGAENQCVIDSRRNKCVRSYIRATSRNGVDFSSWAP